MYICYILPVPANDIAIENIFFYTFWFKYSTSIYKYIFNLCYYLEKTVKVTPKKRRKMTPKS